MLDESSRELLNEQNVKYRMRKRKDDAIGLEDFVQLEGDLDVNNVRGAVRQTQEEAQQRKFTKQDENLKAFFELEWDKDCFMSDNKRQIDFVLAWEETGEKVLATSQSDGSLPFDSDEESEEGKDEERPARRKFTNEEKAEYRRRWYEANLEKMGLELEHITLDPMLGRTKFTLIHAPFHILEKQAQLLSVKLPVKKTDVFFENRTILPGPIDRALNNLRILDFDDATKNLLEEPEFYTAPYSSDRRTNFVNWDRPDLLFPVAERCRMVYDFLTRAHYDNTSTRRKPELSQTGTNFRFGIERLLANSTYSAAFPLHQKLRSRAEMDADPESMSQREHLYVNWASLRNTFKYQPLDSVKRYFGTKVAFYFAWLGYYTKSLYVAAVVGVICVVYGLINMNEDIVSNDICGSDGVGSDIIICPQCESYCDYQRLNSSCLYSKMSYLFDNGMTVIFSALMSIWATLFLEGWKRYHAEIAWKWGLLDFVVEEDTVRPDFQFRVKTRAFNPITQKEEPFLTGKKKAANYAASGAVVLFFICLVLAIVFGMIIYRVICMKLLARMDNPVVDSYAFIIVTVSAASINLLVIMFMNYFYTELAYYLTQWECPRTQADFDNSYTFKVFLFQFVNYYSSLFYIAFFKGVFSQVPGHKDDHGNVKIAGYRLEGCDPAGCFVELFIQLAIIMVGKQFFTGCLEFCYPYLMTILRKKSLRVPSVVETKEQKKARIKEECHKKSANMKRWEEDYYLNPTYDQFLFDEYLEMVLQFGFVTLFVAAFPLAPLFAVINNIIEIRLDARKFLVTTQRPIPLQARNIGVWFNILDVISRMSVTINALVIAFTSDFVPKTMYWFSNKHTMQGYVNSSLAYYDASNFDDILKNSQFKDVDVCRFRGYRRTPCTISNVSISSVMGGGISEACDDSVSLSYEWWKVLAVRLLFVVIFEHIVFLVKVLCEYMIPDVPTKIFIHQQREKYLLRKALLTDITTARNIKEARFLKEIAADALVGGRRDSVDNETTAFQPGAFDVNDLRANGPSPLTRQSRSFDSYETATEHSNRF